MKKIFLIIIAIIIIIIFTLLIILYFKKSDIINNDYIEIKITSLEGDSNLVLGKAKAEMRIIDPLITCYDFVNLNDKINLLNSIRQSDLFFKSFNVNDNEYLLLNNNHNVFFIENSSDNAIKVKPLITYLTFNNDIHYGIPLFDYEFISDSNEIIIKYQENELFKNFNTFEDFFNLYSLFGNDFCITNNSLKTISVKGYNANKTFSTKHILTMDFSDPLCLKITLNKDSQI